MIDARLPRPRAAILDAYRATPYRTCGLTFRIGQRSRPLDRLLAGLNLREATLITAQNPRSRRMPPRWNEHALARLRARLRPWTHLPAESGHGPWREAQFLVAAPAVRLAPLGRHFRQNAIVRLRPAARPALVSLR